MRTAYAPEARHAINTAGGSLSRRWYYTPKSHRAYSVRQIAPGDRRLLTEFAMALAQAPERERGSLREPCDVLFERVLAGGHEMAAGFAALEGTAAGDRVIGVAAYAPASMEEAGFGIAVAPMFRGEQVGRILLATLVRHAKRVGVRRLRGEMLWSNRPMQMLAEAMGFSVEALAGDRSRRGLVLMLR